MSTKLERFSPVVYKTFDGEYGKGYIYSIEIKKETIIIDKGLVHTEELKLIKVSKKPKWEFKEEDLIEVEQVRFFNDFIKLEQC